MMILWKIERLLALKTITKNHVGATTAFTFSSSSSTTAFALPPPTQILSPFFATLEFWLSTLGHTLTVMTHEEQAQAFMQVASQHQAKLIQYARSFTRDNDEAYDLLMNTMLKCHDRIRSRGFQGSYLPYLVSAIKLNFYYSRRRKKNPVVLLSLSTFAAFDLPAEEPGQKEAEHELATAIQIFIASHYIPDEVAMFELHLQGQSDPEIAFLSDCTRWQVRRIRYRIKEDIRKTFSASL